MDPQGNTTSGFGVDKENTEYSVYDLLLGECGIKDAVLPDVFERLSLLPSHIDLAAAEIELIGERRKGIYSEKGTGSGKRGVRFYYD